METNHQLFTDAIDKFFMLRSHSMHGSYVPKSNGYHFGVGSLPTGMKRTGRKIKYGFMDRVRVGS